MKTYLHSIPLPPRVLSEEEQATLLALTGQRRGAFRDHLLISLAFATALREHELVALDVGDVADESGKIRPRLKLRVFKRSSPKPASQEVPLSETARVKLAKFLTWKKSHGQSLAPDAPLFVSRINRRLSTRQVRHLFKVWQVRAGFERPYPFHSTRHSCCTNIYRQTKDLLLVMRLARHKSVVSSLRYSHPSEADLLKALQRVPC